MVCPDCLKQRSEIGSRFRRLKILLLLRNLVQREETLHAQEVDMVLSGHWPVCASKKVSGLMAQE